MGKLSSQTLALVISAIKNMRQSKGSSSRDILNYISSVHDIPQDVAKRQMVAALKRGVAHGIIKKNEGYYSVPTDTEVECMEVAAQELGLLDLCCRRKKREARKGSSCKKPAKVKRRSSRRSKRTKGCKSSGRSRSGRSRSKRRKSRKSGRGKKGCGCKSKSRRGRSKRGRKSRSRRGGRSGGRSGCKPKRKSRRSRKSKCEERALEDESKQKCRTVQLNVETFDSDQREPNIRRSSSRARSKSRSRSCSRNRNILPTA